MSGSASFCICLTAMAAGCLAINAARASADYPFHANPDQLMVTRGNTIINRLSCERITLDGKGRWGRIKGHPAAYIRGQIAETSTPRNSTPAQCG